MINPTRTGDVRDIRRQPGGRGKIFSFFLIFSLFSFKISQNFEKIIFFKSGGNFSDAYPTPLRRRPDRKSEISRVKKKGKKPSANRIRELIRPASASASRTVAEKIFCFFFIFFVFSFKICKNFEKSIFFRFEGNFSHAYPTPIRRLSDA